MSKKDIVLIVVLALIVVGIIIAGIMSRSEQAPTGVVQPTTEEKTENVPGKTQIPSFTPEIPKNAVLTPPKVDIRPDPGETKRQGFYEVKANKDGYAPSSLTVGRGNIVTIDFTSEDAQYDIFSESFGFYVTAPRGDTKQISFKAGTVGSFLFECRDFCPSGKKIQGQLIVIP